MDENLIQELYESPICVDEHTKAELTIAVWNDTLFLSDLNVMDYSLITGITASNEIVVGIIGMFAIASKTHTHKRTHKRTSTNRGRKSGAF
jgi:hypothetical protein